MPSDYPVHLHQSGYTSRSSGSSPMSSTSGNASSRSTSSTQRREYGAAQHTSEVTSRGNGTVVINHNKTGYDNYPSPGYGGSQRR